MKCPDFFVPECLSDCCPITIALTSSKQVVEISACTSCLYYRGCANCEYPQIHRKHKSACRVDHRKYNP